MVSLGRPSSVEYGIRKIFFQFSLFIGSYQDLRFCEYIRNSAVFIHIFDQIFDNFDQIFVNFAKIC